MSADPISWRTKITPLAVWAATVVASAALGAVAHWLGVPPPPPLVVEVEREVPAPVAAAPAPADGPPPGYAEGWSPDPDATNRDAADARFRNFAETPAGQVADIPAEVFLWKFYEKLKGVPTPLKDQNPTGACVGFGCTTAVERSEAAEIVGRRGSGAEMALFSEEVTYAGSKVNGARSMGATVGRADGSAGVFVKAFLGQWGMAPKKKYASCDLTVYDAARARAWNTSGPPADVLAECKKYPVGDVAKVTTWDQAKKALASGYGIGVCADWRYGYQRDARGVAPDLRSGWNHCMCLDGYHTEPDGTEYGHIENSWSNVPGLNGQRMGPAHTGPVGWGSPTTAGFWATSASIDRALRQNDSFAFSRVTGFPARRPDWFIRAEPARRDPFHPRAGSGLLALAW